MIVSFITERVGSLMFPPIWGDERLAHGLAKYLSRRENDVERVDVLDKKSILPSDVDFCIHMQRGFTQRGRIATIYWYQNDHDYDLVELSEQYEALFIASNYHREKAYTDLPALFPWSYQPVVYTDTEDFPYLNPTDDIPVVYLGNNIKGNRIRRKYIDPAIPYGLQIYGSGWQGMFPHSYKGPLTGLASNCKLYTNARIVLACHLQKHFDWNLPVVRATEAMMCRALVISDKVGQDIYGDRIIYTEGYSDLAGLLSYWLDNEKERKEKTTLNRAWAIGNLSLAKQADDILKFFKDVYL